MTRIVLLCNVSNSGIRSRLHFRSRMSVWRWRRASEDYGQWNSVAISNISAWEEVSLTVIFPHYGLKENVQRFSIDGVDYICYRPDEDRLIQGPSFRYPRLRRLVKREIARIKPDLVHIVGAENPYYSICGLDLPKETPLLVSLQTLLADPNFLKSYPMPERAYAFYTGVERALLQRADWIATRVEPFREIVRGFVPDARFISMSLPVGVDVDLSPCPKEYDFVYFSANLNKAGDHAVEAFAKAWKASPGITLNLSGACDPAYLEQLYSSAQALGCPREAIIYTGPKDTHEEVIAQIRKSRFALLPLKVDLVSGTIREAMANGLPVVSSITKGTPRLNRARESLLLAPVGDTDSLAGCMLRLLNPDGPAAMLRENAALTVDELYSNRHFMEIWRLAYRVLASGEPLPEELMRNTLVL